MKKHIERIFEEVDNISEFRKALSEVQKESAEVGESFILHGKIYLSQDRNAYLIDEAYVYSTDKGEVSRVNLKKVIRQFNKVVKFSQLENMFQKNNITIRFNTKFPMTPCAYCEKDFELNSISDCIQAYGIHYHKNCLLSKQAKSTTEFYTKIFKEAGLEKYHFELIKNQYTNNKYEEPWCILHTSEGDIVVGARKRVFSIDWKDIYDKKYIQVKKEFLKNYNYEPRDQWEKEHSAEKSILFQNENVTKGVHDIHAWTEEKLVEYLKKVCYELF